MKNAIFIISTVLLISLLFSGCGGGSKVTSSVQSVSINEKQNNYFAIGEEFTFTANSLPDSTKISAQLDWSVLNNDIASIDSNGKLTGLKTGTTIIKVRHNGFSDTLAIKIRTISENYLRVHYSNALMNFENAGVLLSGDAVKFDFNSFELNGNNYSIANPLMIDIYQTDTYGVYMDIPLLPNASSLRIRFVKKDLQLNQFFIFKEITLRNLQNYNEFWIYETKSAAYIARPDTAHLLTSVNIEKTYSTLQPGDTVKLNVLTSSNDTVIIQTTDWQSSNNELGTINDSGIFTALNPGNAEILCYINGLVASYNIYVEPQIPVNTVRLYYNDFNDYYDDVYFLLTNNASGITNRKIEFNGISNLGRYADVQRSYLDGGSVVQARNQHNVYSSANFTLASDNTYLMKAGATVTASKNSMDKGAIKIANSWGIDDWEKTQDGCFYMTYDLLKKMKASIWFITPKLNYEPKAVALFSIEHPVRDEVRVTIGVGDINNPSREKYFRGFMRLNTIADYDDELIDTNVWLDTNIIFDITELMPFNNETVFIKVYDKNGSGATGFIKNFAVELYNDYNMAPQNIYEADSTPLATIDGDSVYKAVGNVSSAGIMAAPRYSPLHTNISISSRAVDAGDIEKMPLNNLRNGRKELANGLKMPDADEWNKIVSEGRLKYVTSVKNAAYTPISSVDNSLSKYFPPIGDQKQKGSCASWSSGYYTATYYAAMKYDWDLSDIDWNDGNIDTAHQDKLMSPEFLYNLLNGGIDQGSLLYDPFKIISDIGISSFKTAPIIADDFLTWPSEAAWREAPKYRCNYDKNFYWLLIETDDDIESLRNLLRAGYIATIAFDGYQYKNFKSNDTLCTRNYISDNINHAVTVVGFFDEWITPDE